jgi:hypothetical protein
MILYEPLRMHNAARKEDDLAVRYLHAVEDVHAVEGGGTCMPLRMHT